MVENNSLEGITEDTCVHKYASMRNDTPGYLDECRSCPGEYYVRCERYKPLRSKKSFFMFGTDIIKQFYHRFISIDSLPHDTT